MSIILTRCTNATHLHGNQAVVDHDFLGKADNILARSVREGIVMGLNAQVCTNSGLVLVRESLVDILIHERRLADAERDNESGSIYRSGAESTYPESPRMITYDIYQPEYYTLHIWHCAHLEKYAAHDDYGRWWWWCGRESKSRRARPADGTSGLEAHARTPMS